MKLILKNTDQVVTVNGVPGRIWEGETESGVPVHCVITRVAVKHGRPKEDYDQFERELHEVTPVSKSALEAFPLRMVL